MYFELFGGSVVWFSGIFLEQPKLQLSNYFFVFLLMITENGFGIMGFLSKVCWMVRRYCFVIWKTLLTQLIEKENLFKPNKKAMKSKLHMLYKKKPSKLVQWLLKDQYFNLHVF